MRHSKVYIALLHYPMYNKNMDIVTTSVTNLDIHDIARAARTYDVDGFYIVHPSASQQELIQDILAYWQEGYGGRYNSDRQEALRLLRLAKDFPAVLEGIRQETGEETVITVATDARCYPKTIAYSGLRSYMAETEQVYLLLFGTGWGIGQELMDRCDHILEPISGAGGYNHLSVRSAVAIILDRLLGATWYN
ncbi:MAG: RNA methyltransferase [Syntrophomonadaceae bacterium]|nr:RNA methyltransferase [Syntrophomonadaceae bacterium]